MNKIVIFLGLVGVVLANVPLERNVLSSTVTTMSLIEKHGYPAEEYEVQTADKYILKVHRIPYSPKRGPGYNRPVIFLQHGLLCSSSDWVVAGPNSGLAFILSDLGYDVWMGNARGNTYSKDHVSYPTWTQLFWNFDWHEIGLYDLTAMIDKVLYLTGESQLDYVGHSQGTTTFMLLNSKVPTFGSRIRSAHLLAPVAYMSNMESPLAALAGPFLGQPNAFVEIVGSMEFLPNNIVMELLGQTACNQKVSGAFAAVCKNMLFLMGGFNEDNFNATLMPDILATTPAGCSVNQILHYLQEYESGYYREWDYGKVRNKKEYKQKTAPEYPVKNIDAPVYLYFSDNDYMAAVSDVYRVASEMPSKSLKKMHRVEDPKFTHLDYLWGLNVVDQVYNHVIANIRNHLDI